MPSSYLQSTDYAAFGVPSATAQQVTQASVLVDAYLRRPAGLIYVKDSTGQPAYMAALSPELTFTSVGAFGPGNGIQVQVSGPVQVLQVGDCVVLDRANSSLVESVQITSMTGNTLTLGTTAAIGAQGVQFPHAAGCTIDTGLLITEKRYLPKNRSEVMLAHTPVGRIVGGTGRYAYGRRGDAASYNTDNFNLLASISKFGGPPAWEIWPANSAAGIDSSTGQLWVPAGIMLAYYSEIKVRYVAGFQYANLPDEIKLATAQLITAMSQNAQMGALKSYRAGDTAIEQFAATAISDDVKALLNPWRARAFV